MARLSPQQQKFLGLLNSMRVGDVLTRQRLLDVTGWETKSLSTHLSKNKFAGLLEELPDGSFRALRHGDAVSSDDVHRAMTQVNEPAITLHKGDVLNGENGTYVLLDEVGAGAVAHVWRANDSDRECAVAAKVVRPRPDLLDPSRFADVRDRFRREARQGRTLVHDSIVQIFDFGELKGHPFLVMELARQSLGNRLKTEGPLSLPEALVAIRRCASGLRYLHSRGCVHRDIKPDNVLVTERGVVVGDLGIVRWGDLNSAFTSAATMTRASVQLGSWFYMAPEQQQSPHKAVAESDVYSLGVTWYELLTGEVPSPAQFAAKRYENACSVSAVNSLIGSMTNYDPADRPALELIESEAVRLLAGKSV